MAKSDLSQCLRRFSPEKRAYVLRDLLHHLVRTRTADRLTTLLTTLPWLEAKAEAGLAFDLAADFGQAVDTVPASHPKHQVLRLLQEALRRDVHFIARHPSTLFQCLWNICWWYDCPEAERHYGRPQGGWRHHTPPWRQKGTRLHQLCKKWLRERGSRQPRPLWIRSLRAPVVPLGGPQELVLTGHEYVVSDVCCSRTGEVVVSGSGDKTARVWSTQNGGELACLRGLAAPVSAVAFMRNGQRVTLGTGNGEVGVWNWRESKEFVVTGHHGDSVTALAASPIAERVAVGGRDGKVRIWDIEKRRVAVTIKTPSDHITSIAYSPDGRLVAVSGRGPFCRVYQVGSGRLVHVLEKLFTRYSVVTPVEDIAFSPDGQTLAGAGPDGIRLFSVSSGHLFTHLDRPLLRCCCVSFSPKAKWVAAGTREGKLVLWRPGSGDEFCFEGHTRSVNSISFSGSRLVSCSDDMTIRIWRPNHLHPQPVRREEHLAVSEGVQFSANGEVLTSTSAETTVGVWDAKNGTLTSRLLHVRLPEDESVSPLSVGKACPSPDGCLVASGANDGTVRVWRAKSGEELVRLEGHDAAVTSLAFAASGSRVVSTSTDGTCKLWDVCRDAQVACLGGEGHRAFPCALSDDGQLLAVFLEQGEIQTLDAERGDVISRMRVGRPPLIALWFSRRGRFIAYHRRLDRTGSVYLYNWQDDKGPFRIRGLKPVVCSSRVFSADDQWFAGAGKDGTVRVWDLASREEHLCMKGRDYSGSDLLFASSSASLLFGWGENLPLWRVDVARGCAKPAEVEARSFVLDDDLGRQFALRLECGLAEAAILRAGGAEAIAWYPGSLRAAGKHPSGHIWAVAVRDRLELLQLEGEMHTG